VIARIYSVLPQPIVDSKDSEDFLGRRQFKETPIVYREQVACQNHDMRPSNKRVGADLAGGNGGWFASLY